MAVVFCKAEVLPQLGCSKFERDDISLCPTSPTTNTKLIPIATFRLILARYNSELPPAVISSVGPARIHFYEEFRVPYASLMPTFTFNYLVSYSTSMLGRFIIIGAIRGARCFFLTLYWALSRNLTVPMSG
jgi:hypothetical protein